MMRTAEDTAVLLATLFKRSEQKRARFSEKTLRLLSGRKHLRNAFLQLLKQCADDLGYLLTELDRGGFGFLPSATLDGAPMVTVKKHGPGLLKGLKSGEVEISTLRGELEDPEGSDDTED